MAEEDGAVYEFREINGHKFEGGSLKFRIQWTANEHVCQDIAHMGYIRDALVDYHRAYLDVARALLEKNGPTADVAVEEIVGVRFKFGGLQYRVKRAELAEVWEDVEVLSGDDVLAALVRFHDSYLEVLNAFIDENGYGPQDDEVVIVNYE